MDSNYVIFLISVRERQTTIKNKKGESFCLPDGKLIAQSGISSFPSPSFHLL